MAEYVDILVINQFRQGENASSGKWFADTLEGCLARWPKLFPEGDFWVIEADVPENPPSLYFMPNNDGKGPARCIESDELVDVIPRPLRRYRGGIECES